jgi:glutathione peroxidase
MSIYDYSVLDKTGTQKTLSDYQGKVVLIVNTASKCGLTPQYKGLQELYERFQPMGLEILAFPCDQFANQEPGSDEEIQQFCQVNYGITFPVFAKIAVNGNGAHPLYRYLRAQCRGLLNDSIKWNFTKFLVDRNGQAVDRFAPTTQPEKLASAIEDLLAGNAYQNYGPDAGGECS